MLSPAAAGARRAAAAPSRARRSRESSLRNPCSSDAVLGPSHSQGGWVEAQAAGQSESAMSMSVVPRPFHNCRKFLASNLVTIDGVPLPLAEISRRRSVVLAALDLDMSTPSAGQILSQLLLPVYGRSRQGSSGVNDGSGRDVSTTATTEDLHELLLCCDAYIIILAKEPLHQCRELQRELAVAGESFSDSGSISPATRSSASPRLETSGLEGAHLLPGCLSIVHDEGAELLKSLQLVGLDGRTVPAVFKIASNERLQLQEWQFDQAELALHYRQFGLAYAGVQHSLEYAPIPPKPGHAACLCLVYVLLCAATGTTHSPQSRCIWFRCAACICWVSAGTSCS